MIHALGANDTQIQSPTEQHASLCLGSSYVSLPKSPKIIAGPSVQKVN
jgi:hypothetical protein